MSEVQLGIYTARLNDEGFIVSGYRDQPHSLDEPRLEYAIYKLVPKHYGYVKQDKVKLETLIEGMKTYEYCFFETEDERKGQ